MQIPIYKNKTRSIEERVDDLLAQMTLDEKIAQLGGIWVTDLIDDRQNYSTQKAENNIINGMGHITRIAGASLLPPTESAALANSIQRFLVEQTRLGRKLCWAYGPGSHIVSTGHWSGSHMGT
jgi:beta-glucosidase